MKFLVAVVLALAISVEALYPLPEPVVPSAVYGVPQESKPDVVPIKTEYSYTVPAVEIHHEEPHVEVAPVAPIFPVHAVQPEVQLPTLVDAHSIPYIHHYEHPSVLVDHASTYGVPVPSTHIYGPSSFSSHGFVHPHNYGYSFDHSVLPYGYGYSAPHLSFPHPLAYGSSPLLASGVHGVTVTGPSPVSTIVTESHHIPEIVHEVVPQHPIVSNYGYNLPHVVVSDVAKPVVPQAIYGVPEIPSPVVPHSTYGVPLLK